MRIIFLGSFVVGVTSAYYLTRQGHEVALIDRHAQPALVRPASPMPAKFPLATQLFEPPLAFL